jgi:hypothetical protein
MAYLLDANVFIQANRGPRAGSPRGVEGTCTMVSTFVRRSGTG